VAIAELGTASILVEGQGALIAPDNAAQFAERVLHLLSYPEERFELGHSARIYALDLWTAKFQAERMLKFYGQLKTDWVQKKPATQVLEAQSLVNN